jgi:NAD(P)-dependent dehydrogenase (short-subunit alcohol dehydrogenase family)
MSAVVPTKPPAVAFRNVFDSLSSLIPVGRIGASEEIAAAVLYLCSDNAKFATGTSLVVDGGFIAQ